MDKPLVSVIIPAFDAAANIRQTLNSVLAQTYQEMLRPGIYGTFIRILLNLVTDQGGKPLAREVLPLPTEKKGKAPNTDCKEKWKHPSISNRIFVNIERGRWSAALDDGD